MIFIVKSLNRPVSELFLTSMQPGKNKSQIRPWSGVVSNHSSQRLVVVSSVGLPRFTFLESIFSFKTLRNSIFHYQIVHKTSAVNVT